MLNHAILDSAYSAILEDKTMLMTVVTVTGILVVFAALILLIILISVFGKATNIKVGGKKPAARKTEQPSPAKSAVAAAPAAPAVQAGISDEIVAVIAAAVASMEGSDRLAVRSIRRAPAQGRSAWASAGIAELTRPF